MAGLKDVGRVVEHYGINGRRKSSNFRRELARRTGRFPQLVGPRSSVNGLLLTGSPRFREVSLEETQPLQAQVVCGE